MGVFPGLEGEHGLLFAAVFPFPRNRDSFGAGGEGDCVEGGVGVVEGVFVEDDGDGLRGAIVIVDDIVGGLCAWIDIAIVAGLKEVDALEFLADGDGDLIGAGVRPESIEVLAVPV